jgi:MSHA biogenesis protein MshJ
MSQWQQYSERFLTLQLRERYLIGYGSALLLLWLGALYLLQPLWQMQAQLQQQNRSSLQQIVGLQQQIDEVQRALTVNPDQQLQQNIDKMLSDEQQLLTQIRSVTGRYIGAEQMVQLLQDVLSQQQNIRLIALENLPARAVQLPGVGLDAAAVEKPLLYRHSTKLTFAGPYAGLQQLLQRLEQLPWQLHWRTLNYQVKEYPQAELQLELETVSEHDSYLKI